jgi:transcription-repair coupling factor (superfamily II helicase)
MTKQYTPTVDCRVAPSAPCNEDSLNNINQSALIHHLCTAPNNIDRDILFICKTEEETLASYNLAKFFAPDINAFYFPSWDTIAYDRVSPSKHILSQRAKILSVLCNRQSILSSSSGEDPKIDNIVIDSRVKTENDKVEKIIIFTSPNNLLQKLPPVENFKNRHLEIFPSDKITIEYIANFLVENGFIRTGSAIEPGEFAQRGEIFDIVITENEAYRLIFSWNKLEQIKILDPLSQISDSKIDRFEIYPSSEMSLSKKAMEHFKGEFLKLFTVNQAENPLYLAITEGRYISGCEQILSLCYSNMVSICDYLKNPSIIYAPIIEHIITEEYESIEDFYDARRKNNALNPSQFYPVFEPGRFYFSDNEVRSLLHKTSSSTDSWVKAKNDIYDVAPDFYLESKIKQQTIGALAKRFFPKYEKILIFCPTESGIEKIKYLLNVENVETRNISFVKLFLQQSFIKDDSLYIKHQDLIGEKNIYDKASSNKRLKNILQELETFEEGDLVVHEEHGIGKFIAIENITVLGIRHDCIKLLYDGDDKLYIPVENIDVIKKYGSDDANLDRLGGVSWQKRKSKLKNRISELSKKLIAIAAERKAISIEPIYKTPEYGSFEDRFPYSETEDQLTAIADIEKDLSSNYPMDRLICGDVGFGKTEIAMRAAFLVASSGKQVAIIAPTTILARQHYNNFIERFAQTNFKISSLSRLTPKSHISDIVYGVAMGTINIIIGTHALLAPNIKFHDLGMVIIDEEQHFGVMQKERLKEMKHSAHVLALSATPIPRTLQMSMLGIRDLSLIATPPIDRLSVRTNIIPNDPVIIRDALMREHYRGGRSFYVAPRIKDLESIELELKTLVPELKYIIAHGRMAPTIIDKIMTDFYDGKYDILLCTTIIESGIDIPAANTIIIHKSEMLGLGQLYQLRGRVGRSKVRGFSYLIINNSKTMTHNASKRLDIMQNIDSLGAGFTIASYDSDIRGFGNLVGDEQSGHIKEVGAELYQEMLEQAVGELQHIKPEYSSAINLNINVPIYIPDEYIEDGEQRLAIYKRISSLSNDNEIEQFNDELIDRFGAIPEPTKNLLFLVKIKLLCKKLQISDLDAGPNGVVIKFLEDEKIASMVMKFLQTHPKNTKLRPDNKLVILTSNIALEKIYSLLEEIGR